ncbi:MAG: type II toxin-antitoxin system VapC family toxin [Pseudomonadota bacterium]
MLIDSNIIIYAAQPRYEDLRQFIMDHVPAVSAISYVEVLGYHQLTEQERRHFDAFFKASLVLPLSQKVLEQAVRLRQRRRMSLGDALVAGTALAFNRTLVTRNIDDFKGIKKLSVLNPFETDS